MIFGIKFKVSYERFEINLNSAKLLKEFLLDNNYVYNIDYNNCNVIKNNVNFSKIRNIGSMLREFNQKKYSIAYNYESIYLDLILGPIYFISFESLLEMIIFCRVAKKFVEIIFSYNKRNKFGIMDIKLEKIKYSLLLYRSSPTVFGGFWSSNKKYYKRDQNPLPHLGNFGQIIIKNEFY